VNDADGHIQAFLEVVAEGIGHRGEAADRVRARLIPLGEVFEIALVVDGRRGGSLLLVALDVVLETDT
jgi:hypothetical protein